MYINTINENRHDLILNNSADCENELCRKCVINYLMKRVPCPYIGNDKLTVSCSRAILEYHLENLEKQRKEEWQKRKYVESLLTIIAFVFIGLIFITVSFVIIMMIVQ